MRITDDLIASDIGAYLEKHEEKSLLRFITCGSVDDGKSTLIGRLLYDSKMIFEDQLATLDADSKKHGTQGEGIEELMQHIDKHTKMGLQNQKRSILLAQKAYRLIQKQKMQDISLEMPIKHLQQYPNTNLYEWVASFPEN